MSTRILLVEDDGWLAELETDVLRKVGYEVTHVTNAEAAIEAVDTVKPEVLVADMLLTGTTALALLHELQSYPDTKAIPVIVCTNLAEGMSVEDLKAYGVRGVVDKTTMHPDDLAAAVRKVLL